MNKVSVMCKVCNKEELVSTSRSKKLLTLTLQDQIGVFKLGELQESLEEDNLQLIINLNG